MKLDKFTRGYLKAALWTSTNDDGEPYNKKYTIEDIDSLSISSIVADCKAFQETYSALLTKSQLDDERAGVLFWLTRNWHGTGFWDELEGALGKRLTDAAHSFGESDLYTGDDGKIHVHPLILRNDEYTVQSTQMNKKGKEMIRENPRSKHNDEERRQWVNNDEGLYNAAQMYEGGVKAFIRDNREFIDQVIDNVISGSKRAHYLAYDKVERNPKQTSRKLRINDTEIHTWFERGRAHVELRDKKTRQSLLDFWDDNVHELVEDGFLNPRDWHGSMFAYYKHLQNAGSGNTCVRCNPEQADFALVHDSFSACANWEPDFWKTTARRITLCDSCLRKGKYSDKVDRSDCVESHEPCHVCNRLPPGARKIKKNPFREDAFMKPVVEFGTWIEIDGPNGVDVVSADLADLREVNKLRAKIRIHGSADLHGTGLGEFTENRIAREITVRKGYGAHMSAPGYMDQTEWSVFNTEKEAWEYLEEYYGEEIEEEEE